MCSIHILKLGDTNLRSKYIIVPRAFQMLHVTCNSTYISIQFRLEIMLIILKSKINQLSKTEFKSIVH